MRVSAQVERWTELLACLLLGAALSVMMGQDASWDLRNYHLYNPVSLLQERLDLDFFAADKQTGNNPLPDLLYAWLALGPLRHAPRMLAALMGLWWGVMAFIALRITAILLAHYESRMLILVGAVTAVTGAMAWSQIGSASNDMMVGTLILGGLLCVMRAENTAWKFAAGGALFGFCAGAKLTGGVFAPAMVLAFLAAMPWRKSLRASAWFTLGWLTGFAAAFGWWGWMLWQRYDNPVFPLFNGIFKSPLAPALNLRDMRFLPQNAWQWIAYPFYWAFDASRHPVFEDPFRDPRLALAYVTLAVLACVRLSRKSPTAFTEAQAISIAFLILSYVMWLMTTSILRYAIPVEVLAVPVALVILMQLAAPLRTISPKAPVAFAALLCFMTVAVTRYPAWERRAFNEATYNVDMGWVQKDTLFIGIYAPMGYLAAFVPPEKHAAFLGLAFLSYVKDTPLGEAGRARVRDHKGPVMVIVEETRRSFLPMLELVGLSPDVGHCRTIEANLAPPGDTPVYACEASRL